jgi:hypothetical protein
MRTFVPIITGLFLATVAAPARAHIAEGTVTLTTAEEVPAPTGVDANAQGTALITLEDDKTIVYEVVVNDLTGLAIAAHIHDGLPGVAGPVLFSLTPATGAQAGLMFAGTTPALTDEQVSKFLRGDLYVNVHTAANPAGEIRGQIFKGACSCKTLTKKAFRSCVANAIKGLEKEQKQTDAIRGLKKAVKKAAVSCGATTVPKKKQAACCLTTEASYIVSGQLCQPVKKESQCKDGTFVDEPCAPTNPCPRPASPSGAFID